MGEKLYFHTSLLVSDPSELGNYMFPKAKIENVYEAWKPIDYGHPLVDPTIHYAPPELERVHIGPGPVPARPPKIHKHNLVFEAAREVRAHKDDELQAEVYNSPRYDKGEHWTALLDVERYYWNLMTSPN